MTSFDWCTTHQSKENPARISVCMYASEHVVFEECSWTSSRTDPEKWLWEEEDGPMTIAYKDKVDE